MKNKIIYVLSSIVIIGFIIVSVLSSPSEPVSKTYYYLGTVIDITLYEDNEQVFQDISDLILKYDNLFSRNIPTSDISKLNESGRLTVDEETFSLIHSSVQYSELSDGYFDITINPIVELWDIGGDNPNVPSDEAIQDALKNVSYKHILYQNNEVLLKSGTSIDLGGIAKGYITDQIVNLLKNNQIEKALINLGGNVYALGSNPEDEDWQIGIRHPELERADAILKLSLQNKSIVTSGVYERFLEDQGQIYHHIFDPFTGYPMDNNLLSVTIISDQSLDGDALSTACFNLGTEKAFELADSLGIDIIVITKDHEAIVSKNLKDHLELLDDQYTLTFN
ncbi:FAD:protein FMN transferase [Acidaminobacter sp. JC074]|uniref:FAD:protein FMN transferase n=1 Tax=Acidaminobacter sp. JC074 TaxID=2530199 RepID=UPI001F103B23|nr:FAD:protein FMN transferase [Acidaminobacter sp. JC074]MCH4890556.1 FAD:protein FMN transferase [Acidaminobacter sp. JC074]